jgi:hypothetical protein
MNKATLLLFNVLIVALFACKNDPKQVDPNRPENFQVGDPADPTVLAGYWINLDFCARASQYGSVLQTMNNSHAPYAYAFMFNPGNPDSVTCYNATESWNLPVKYKKDTLELMGASKGKSLFLVYHSEGEKNISMFDNTNGSTNMDNFIKSRANAKDGYGAFTTALNHHILGGVFTPIGKAGATKVMFTPGGFIQGMKDYDRYEICTGGDCFVAGQEIDVVSFYNASKGKEASEKLYGYRYDGGNDTLSIYNMVNAKPEVKGGYKVGALANKYAREISVSVSALPKPKKQ